MRWISLGLLSLLPLFAMASQDSDWQTIEKQARGQDVYFNAWGGSQEINDYLRWVSREVKRQYGVTLHHVKVSDISETTARLLAEKTANKNQQGSVDLVWINGENFKSMKDNQLLFGPFVSTLPNWQKVNMALPVTDDFSEPTNGLEAPWGVGQLVYIYDRDKLASPPQSAQDLLEYAKAHPGRISYPKPPQFHGTSFLKSLLIELSQQDPALQQPVTTEAFAQLTQPLWRYLDALQPFLWQQGQQFPTSQAEMIQLLDDDQLDLAITFNPNEVFSAQASGKLASSTASYAWKQGALSNIHFLAIPWNANSKQGALVVINFLLSPEAQSRKGDINIWGDPSVLQPQYLTGSAQKTKLYPSLPEPHPSWQTALEQAWLERYSQ
ncbi:ABC transporter substrate-binding protein [Vibrio gangliei]|uniref:ABC transporter substrate-binding protein n=1 Tax=Vibrio gangliei TaxID=2077090 RepID=UPI000D014F20|nr:ABC transporter substrate-binding protein [Vibrio gangliei]